MARHKSNGRKREGVDRIDEQILAIKALKPEETYREIAKQVGVNASTVCKRLQRLMSEIDWVRQVGLDLEALLPLAVENYQKRLGADDDSADAAADKLLAGLGYFRTKHDVKHEIDPAAVRRWFLGLPDDERQKAITALVGGGVDEDGSEVESDQPKS